MFLLFYFLFLFLLTYSFINAISNKFIKYFFTPLLVGIFGSFWFIEPGSSQIVPIVAIFFLELTILDFNGTERLARPMLSFIFLLYLFSLSYYFFSEKIIKKI